MKKRINSGTYDSEHNKEALKAATLEEANYFDHLVFTPFNYTWQLTVTVAITISCTFTGYTSFFCQQTQLFRGLTYVYMNPYIASGMYFLSEFIYMSDLFLLAVHRFARKLRVTRPYPPVSKKALLIGAITIIPSFLNVKTFIFHDTNLILSYVRLLILLRLHRTFKIYGYLISSLDFGRMVLICYFFAVFPIIVTYMAIMFSMFLWSYFSLWLEISPEKTILIILPIANGTKFDGWPMVTQQDIFLFAFYVSTNTVLGRGQLSFTPTIVQYIGVYQLCMILTLFSRFYTMAAFAAIAIHKHMNNIQFNGRKERLKTKLSTLELSKETYSRIMNWYDVLWTERRGVIESPIAETLPVGLYQDSCLDIFFTALKHSHIFKDFDTTFLTAISVHMKTTFHCSGDVLYKKGMLRDTMCYIHMGVVHVMSTFDDSTPIVSLFPGTCFGESTLIVSYPCSIKISCATYCELKILTKNEFFNVVKMFPVQFRSMQQRVHQRYQKAQLLFAMKMIKRKNNFLDRIGQHDDGALKRIKRVSREIDRTMFSKSTGKFDQEDKINKITNLERLKTEYIGTCSDYLDLVVISHITNESNTETLIKATCPIIFHPVSPFIKLWNSLILVCVIIMTFLIPYEAGLGIGLNEKVNILSDLIQTVFVLDVILQCSFAVITKEKIYKSMYDIFYYRISTIEYKCDVVASLPLNFFVSCYESLGVNSSGLLKLNYVLRAWRIIKIFNDAIDRSYTYRKQILLLSYTCYFVYFICYWSMVFSILACYDNKCHKKSMWAMTEGIDISSTHPVRVILKKILKVVLLCLGEGDGQTQPFTLTEHMCTLAMSTMFLFLDSFITAGMCANQVHMLSSRELRKYTVVCLLNFAAKHRLPQQLEYRIQRQLKIVQSTQITQYTFTDTFDVTGLSEELRKEIKLSAWVSSILEMPLFKDTERKFICEVVDQCRSITFPPNEIVVYSGVFPSYFYVVKRGFCKILSETGEVEGIKGSGWSFAALELTLGIPVIKTIKTLTSCEFIVCEKSDFFTILQKFPLYDNEIKNTKIQCKQLFDLPVVEGANDIYFSRDRRHKSFYNFGYNMTAGSKAEKEFLEPFARIFGNFTPIRFLLLRSVILPTGKAIWLYEIVRSCLALCSCLFFPAKIIFVYHSSYYVTLFYILDATAYIDLYVRLHVAYYTDEGIIVKHPLMTALHYMKNGFFFDLLGCFPFEKLFSQLAQSEYAQFWMCYNRVCQIHRIIGFLNFTYKSKVNPKPLIVTFQYFIILVVVINLLASITFLNNCLVAKKIKMNFNTYHSVGVFCESLNYSPWQFGRDLTPTKVYVLFQYFVSLLVAQVNITGIGGWGTTGALKLIACIFGYLMTVYLTGHICGTTFNENFGLKFQHQVKQLMRFLDKQKINKDLKEEFIHYFDALWEKHEGMSPKQHLLVLNKSLQSDILYHVYGRNLKEYTIFSKTTMSFFWSVLLLFDPLVFHKGCVIVTEGFILDSVFLINEGFVTVISGKRSIMTLKKGSFFGNLFSTKSTQQSTSFVADTTVEVLTVTTDKFFSILDSYPHYKELYRKSLNRFLQLGICAIPSTVEDQADDDETNKTSKKWLFAAKRYECIRAAAGYCSGVSAIYMIACCEFTIWMVVLIFVFDLISMAFMVINCYKPYRDKIGEYETNLHKIRFSYRKKKLGFWFDLFSILPFEVFMFVFHNKSYAFVKLHFNRVFKYITFWAYLMSQLKKISTKQNTTIALHLIIHFYTLIYGLAAALAIIYAFSDDEAIPSHTFTRYRQMIQSITLMLTNFAHYPYQGTFPYLYSTIIICRSVEMVIVIIFSAVIMGYFLLFIESYYFGVLNYINLQEKILHSLRIQRVGKYLHGCAETYLKFLWDINGGSQRPEILAAAPKSLQLKLFKTLYQNHIDNHFIFSNCQNFFTDQLLFYFTEELSLPENIIVRMGTKDSTMYFIHKGEVREYTINKEGKEVLKNVLLENDIFGTKQGLYEGEAHTSTYKAHTTTTILKLNFKSWEFLLEFFPVEKRRIYKLFQQHESNIIGRN